MSPAKPAANLPAVPPANPACLGRAPLVDNPGERAERKHAGVEHRPLAEREAPIARIEPKGRFNTGKVRNQKTVETRATL